MTSSTENSLLGQPLLDEDEQIQMGVEDGGGDEAAAALLPPGGCDNVAPSPTPPAAAAHVSATATTQGQQRLTYVAGPFRRLPHRWATFTLLVLSCASSLFTDSDSIPPLEMAYPALFLCFVAGTQSTHAAALGLIPLALCRSVSATDYFRLGLSTGTAYGLCLVITFVVWTAVLGAALVQKRAWLDAQAIAQGSNVNAYSLLSKPSLSPLVFPILVTALYQLLFRLSPIGAASNPAMGLAYVPALRQLASLFGEISLVFGVSWFGSVLAGWTVGRTSQCHLWFFGVVALAVYVYGWAREGYGMGFMMQSIEDWPLARAAASPLRVACLTRTTTSSDADADDATTTMITRTNDRLAAGDDLVVWSEVSVWGRPPSDGFDWSSAGNNSGAVIAMAYGDKTAENKSHNSVELLQANQSLSRYDKNRPVPVIESEFTAGAVPPTSVNATFTPASTNSTHLGERADLTLRISTAICFDFDFPYLLRNAHDADLVVGPSWYWASLGRNLWGDNVFRAIEDGFTLIKCADNGMTGAVDPYGRIIAAMPTLQDSVHAMEVPVQRGVWTVYAHGGYVFGWLCVMACPLVVYLVLYRNSTEQLPITAGDGTEIGGGYQYLPDAFDAQRLDEYGTGPDDGVNDAEDGLSGGKTS